MTTSKPAQKFTGQNLSCADRRLAKSVGVGKAVSVTFVNRSDGRRSVFWRNEKGALVPYGDLDYGESLVLDTFTNHPWEMTDGPGNCIARVLITKSQTVDLVHPSPAFGPE